MLNTKYKDSLILLLHMKISVNVILVGAPSGNNNNNNIIILLLPPLWSWWCFFKKSKKRINFIF